MGLNLGAKRLVELSQKLEALGRAETCTALPPWSRNSKPSSPKPKPNSSRSAANNPSP